MTKPPPYDSRSHVLLLCYRIDILDLDKCFHVLLEHASEKRLKFRATEVLEHLSPLRRVVKSAQIRPHVAAQDAEGRRLADTVGAYETKNLACTWGGQSMQFEAVCAVAMSDLAFESLWQVDDFNCRKGTPLDAHTAAVTQVLRDEANLRSGLHIDAHFADLVHGTRLGALLSALLGFALIWVNDCDSELLIRHVCIFFSSRVWGFQKNYK